MNVVTDRGKSRLSSSIRAISLSAVATSLAVAGAHANDSTGGGQSFRLEEVIVTAQRRQENLQEVPISVANISADILANAGVDATISIPELVPSVQLVRSGP
ncbi:MAG TPA: TonB-dependent receptor, partial [Pseudomonadaceae bacterium]|nr:TonB-dependent receptor [Pseudomonadaceae bacterium]